MQDGGGMLQLAALADDGGLAIALDNTGIDIERCDRLVAEQLAQLLADLHQDLQVVLKAIGEGIGDHRQRRRPTRRRRDLPAHLLASLLDRSEEHTSELQSLMRKSYAVFC